MAEKQMVNAVREWPPVMQALMEGHQVYLLRKGPLSKTPFEELQKNPVLVLPSSRKLSPDCFSPPAITKYGDYMEPKESDTLTTSLALDLLMSASSQTRCMRSASGTFTSTVLITSPSEFIPVRKLSWLYQVRAHTLEKPVELPASVLGQAYTNLIELPEPLEFVSAKEALSAPALKNSDAWSLNNSKLDSHNMANAQCFLSREEDSHKALDALVDQINKDSA